MKKIKKAKLEKILINHQHWLREDCEGWQNMKADLSYTDLQRMNLSNADLRFADLSCVNLSYANLSGADLSGTNLNYADLRYVDLAGVNLSDANLYCTFFADAKNVPYIPMACPSEGAFVGYKKAGRKIVVLEIPADAKRSSATSSKCRCDKARVLAIEEIDGRVSKKTEVRSNFNKNFIYRVGEMVSVPNFYEDRFVECAPGIHFFMSRDEAKNYCCK